MKNLLFGIPIILCFGLTLGRNVIKDDNKDSQLPTEQNKEEIWNPIKELLGLNNNDNNSDTFPDLFQKHSIKMDKTMKEHQKLMDNSMAEHQKILDSTLENVRPVLEGQHFIAVGQHQKAMKSGLKQHMKDMTLNFDKDWEQFDKDMTNMFKEFDEQMDHMSDPFEKIKDQETNTNTDEKMSTNEEKGAQSRTGLPVFHPRLISIETIDNNSSEGLPQMEDNSTQTHLLSQMMDSITNSFTDLGTLLTNIIKNESNETIDCIKMKDSSALPDNNLISLPFFTNFFGFRSSENVVPEESGFPYKESKPVLERKVKLAFLLHILENVLMGRITRVAFEDFMDDSIILDNEGINENDIIAAEERVIKIIEEHKKVVPYALMWNKQSWEISELKSDHYNKFEMLDKVVEKVSKRILTLIRKSELQKEMEKNSISAKNYIEKQLRREFIIKRENDDYEWYEWLSVGLIAGTSSLLLIVTLSLCCQRMRSRKVDLESNDKQDFVSNENLSDMYREKIKTIFVNLK